MDANVQAGEWVLLSENKDAVLSALERGETDGILPAASGVMDSFAEFLLSTGIPRILDGFADYRKRKSISPFLFCNLLLHKALFRLDSLSQIGPFLFSSPEVLRALGFNMRQIQEGFYSGSRERPLNVEALGDFFAMCELPDFQSNQKEVLTKLLEKYPDLLLRGTLIMDCIEIRIPPGHRGRKATSLEACVICIESQGEILPILWNFIPAKSKADITQGKAMMEEILPIAGHDVKRLIVDRGFISGEWISRMKSRGIDTFMEESRYGCLNSIGPCREGVGAAIAHFSLLSYTLLRLFAREEEAEKETLRPTIPTAGIEFVAYWGEYYAIIFPSELVEIVARCAPSWGKKLPGILKKLKALEAAR